MNITTTNERTLEACILALSRWKDPLPPDLRSKIQAAGHQLTQDESAVGELRNLLKQHGDLGTAYEDSRRELYKRYSARERSKSAAVLQNGSASSGNLIVDLATSILTADNFSSTARQLVLQPNWQAQIKTASEDTQTFFKTLEETVTRLDPLSEKLLEILDKDAFMPDDLAYRVELSEEQINPKLERLWREGYIHTLSKTAIGNLWRSLNLFTSKEGPFGPDNYFALTAKGYFYLHPFLRPSNRAK